MTRLSTTSISEYLDALAAATPAPGGGSAAGVTAAIGAALVEMVASLSLAKGDRENAAVQRDARERASGARAELLQLAEDDVAAFGAFMGALKLPKGSDAESVTRRSALSTAARRAAEVPLATLRAAVIVAEAARSIIDCSLAAAASDLAVAARLARSAGESAAENIEANLPYIEEAETRGTLANQAATALSALHRATPQ